MKYITSLGTFSIDQTTKISAISTYICTKQKTSNKLMMSRWFNSWPFDSLGWRSFKPVPKASRFHHPKKVTNCRIAWNWWTESPWKSKTKPRIVFGMIHIKDSPLPRGKVWYLDFLRHHDVRFVVFFFLGQELMEKQPYIWIFCFGYIAISAYVILNLVPWHTAAVSTKIQNKNHPDIWNTSKKRWVGYFFSGWN